MFVMLSMVLGIAGQLLIAEMDSTREPAIGFSGNDVK
jgi:hypothetical protein